MELTAGNRLNIRCDAPFSVRLAMEQKRFLTDCTESYSCFFAFIRAFRERLFFTFNIP